MKTHYEEHEQVGRNQWNWKRLIGGDFVEQEDGSLRYSLSVGGALGAATANRMIPRGKWRKRESKTYSNQSLERTMGEIVAEKLA